MNLDDLYQQYFSEEEKTASAQGQGQEGGDFNKEAAEEQAGEMAGQVFNECLDESLLAYTVKLAAEGGEKGKPDSEATKDIQKGPGVVPGAKTEDPQLETQKNRHGEKDDTAIDTKPKHYNLSKMDQAKEQAKIEKMLANNNVSEVSHTNQNVDTGMEEPKSQKTASIRYRDLTKEQLDLLQEEFPEDMKKQAQQEVEQEFAEIAELEKEAQGYYDYGSDLAMSKIAEMEEKQKKKKKEEEEEGEGEEEKDDEEKESEKNASAAGKFIFQGYWDTLMEKGAEYYGAENAGIYVEELIKEAKYDKVMKYLKDMAAKGKGAASKAGKHVKDNRKMYGAGGAGAAGGGAAGYAAGKGKKED